MEKDIIMIEEYWQDEHIIYDDGKFGHAGKFICYDECGEYLTRTNTIEEARDQLELYSIYRLNNISD